MIALALAIALLAPQEPQQWTFNGITSATTLEEFMPHVALETGGLYRGRDRCQRMPGLTFCEVSGTWLPDIAGEVYMDSRASFGSDGVIDGLWFALNKPSYPRVAEALTTRYGEPCEDKSSTLQNTFGATVEQRAIKWCFSDGSLVAWEADPTQINRMAIGFYKAKPRRPAAAPNF